MANGFDMRARCGVLVCVLSGLVLSAGGPAEGAMPARNPHVVDRFGDANAVNDQVGNSFGIVPSGGTSTPTDLSDVGDIESAWFTTNRKGTTLHIRTEAPPDASSSIYYVLWFNRPTSPGTACEGIHILYTESIVIAEAISTCEAEEPVNRSLPLDTSKFPDGTGHIRVAIPNYLGHPAFASGQTIASPMLLSRVVTETPIRPVRHLTLDTTSPGVDYTIP